jgi:adenylate kinase family enzyme
MSKKLYIVRGLPGSGKSTFAEALVGSDFLVCEADKYFMVDGEYKFDGSKLKEAHESCRNLVETYMKDSLVNDQFYREIAVSNTFTQSWEMAPYFELAEKYGYMVFTVIVENRHGGVNQHGVPDDKLEQMKARFEVQLTPVKEIHLEDVFSNEKKEDLKKFINEHKNGK